MEEIEAKEVNVLEMLSQSETSVRRAPEVVEQEPVGPPATEAELKELLNKDEDIIKTYGNAKVWKPTEELITDLTVSQFFDEFLADGAPFGFAQLAALQSQTAITATPWKKKEMKLNSIVPLVGVPFISQTRATKTTSIIHRSETKLIFEVDVKTHDAPYGDTFTCKEAWVVIARSGNEPRSILQMKARIAFVKSTMWKNKIEGRAIEGLRETHALWVKHVKAKGHLKKKAVDLNAVKQEGASAKENVKEEGVNL